MVVGGGLSWSPVAPQYDGDWVRGVRTGTGRETAPGGDLYEGAFQVRPRRVILRPIAHPPARPDPVQDAGVESLPIGPRTAQANRRHGRGTLTTREGDVYTGLFVEGDRRDPKAWLGAPPPFSMRLRGFHTKPSQPQR